MLLEDDYAEPERVRGLPTGCDVSTPTNISVALRKQPTKCDHRFGDDPWNEK